MDMVEMARPKAICENPYKKQLVEAYLDHDLPVWLDDVITGASRSQGSTKISPMMLLTLLTMYDSLTTLEIKTFLNRKREAIEGRALTDESYFRDIRRACECAVNAITHQLEHGKKFSDSSYVFGSLEVMIGQF